MILRGEIMIKTTDMLLNELSAYANPKTKLSRMVKKGECFRFAKGLYETNCNTPAYLLAGSIYGPSYISFEFALNFYGLIPEAVHVVTCASFEKKKKKIYDTVFGTFTYRDVPAAAFPFGLKVLKEGDYYYRIASPEKALCDKIYTEPPVSNIKELEALLFEDLRIDEDEFNKLDADKISFLYDKYHSTNVKRLSSYIRRQQR